MKCPFTHKDNLDSSEKCLWSASCILLWFGFFYCVLRKWFFNMSENQPSKLLVVPVLEFLTAEMESALEQEHE